MLSHQIIASHPAPLVHNEVLAECINACYDSAHACMSCADACLAETETKSLRRCIHNNVNCADICTATARLLTRQTDANLGLLIAQVKCCREANRICARECDEHRNQYRHCAACADVCQVGSETCRELLKAFQEIPQ